MKKFDYEQDFRAKVTSGDIVFNKTLSREMTVKVLLNTFNGSWPQRSDVQREDAEKGEEKDYCSRVAAAKDGTWAQDEMGLDPVKVCIAIFPNGDMRHVDGGHNLRALQAALENEDSSILNVLLNVKFYNVTNNDAAAALLELLNSGRGMSRQEKSYAHRAAIASAAPLIGLSSAYRKNETTSLTCKLIGAGPNLSLARTLSRLENIAMRVLGVMPNSQFAYGDAGDGRQANADYMYVKVQEGQLLSAINSWTEWVAKMQEVAPYLLTKTPTDDAMEFLIHGKNTPVSKNIITATGAVMGAMQNTTLAQKVLDALATAPDTTHRKVANILLRVISSKRSVGKKECTAIEQGNSQSKNLYLAQKAAYAEFFRKAAKEMEAQNEVFS